MPFFLISGRYAAALLLLMALVVSGCRGQGTEADDEEALRPPSYDIGEPITDDAYAAIVESEYGADTLSATMFRQQYDMIMQRIPQIAGDPQQQQELRRNIIEEFVRRHVVFGEADRAGVTADTAVVAEQFGRIRGQFPTDEEFQEALAQNDLTEDSLRASIAEDVRQQQMLEQIAESVEDPSEEDIEDFRQRQSEEVRAQHILFLTQPEMDDTDRSEVRERAEAVLDSARQGVDFAELARRHSDDGSAAQGGDLGYFRRGQMVPEFERAAFALSDSGDVTRDLVETQYGYHIIRLTDRRTGEVMDTTMARQRLAQQRRQRAVQERVRDLAESATVRINEDLVDADLNRPAERP